MKKLAFISLLLAALLLLLACAQDPFEEYENFLNDLDVNSRIEDALTAVGQGNTSGFFRDEVATLYEDLGTFDQSDYRALEINQYYSNCVSDLLQAIDYRKADNQGMYQSYLSEALDYYQTGRELYSQFLVQYNHKNNYN